MQRKLAPIDWRTLVKIFEADGFIYERTKGSHMSYVKKGVARPVVVPVFIIKNNMRTAGMSTERFFELLDRC